MIVNYDCNHSFIVLATVITIINYNRKTLTVQATSFRHKSQTRLKRLVRNKGSSLCLCRSKKFSNVRFLEQAAAGIITCLIQVNLRPRELWEKHWVFVLNLSPKDSYLN